MSRTTAPSQRTRRKKNQSGCFINRLEFQMWQAVGVMSVGGASVLAWVSPHCCYSMVLLCDSLSYIF